MLLHFLSHLFAGLFANSNTTVLFPGIPFHSEMSQVPLFHFVKEGRDYFTIPIYEMINIGGDVSETVLL